MTFATPHAPAVLFPGQASQTPEVRGVVRRRCPELFGRCLDLVGGDPFLRVEESTRFQQPANFCASWAGWTAPRDEPRAAAGHSLGELAAAGALALDDALVLVALRGEPIAEADPHGSIVALVGAEPEDAAAIAGAANVIVANDNAPGQNVVGGPRERLADVEDLASARGARAFHSPSMEPAVAPFREALDKVAVSEPRFPVISCASEQPFEDVRAELAAALTRPVRWRETTFTALHEAALGRFVEAGAGKVPARLGKRIVAGTKAESVDVEVAHA